MHIKAGGGVLRGGLVRRLNQLGEVEVLHSSRAGRQLRSNNHFKGMAHPFSDGRQVDVVVRETLKWHRRKFHKVERHFASINLKDLVQAGGYQADIVAENLVDEAVFEILMPEDSDVLRFNRKVRQCRAVMVKNDDGEFDYIY
jgi:hypothetical protein